MTYIPDHPRAEEAMRRWDELKQGRGQHEADWEELARLIRPQRGGFVSAMPDGGATAAKPLSSAPIVAQSNFVSGLYGAMMNPSNKWFGLKVSDPAMAERQEVKLWQDMAAARVLSSFGPQVSPFYSAGIQLFADVASFGNSAQYDEVVRSESRIMDVTLSLAEVVCEIDAFGRVVEVAGELGGRVQDLLAPCFRDPRLAQGCAGAARQALAVGICLREGQEPGARGRL